MIVFAFGLEDERQHSPNEFFRISSFDRGQRAYGMLLNRLAKVSHLKRSLQVAQNGQMQGAGNPED
jgi:hypothetical protein